MPFFRRFLSPARRCAAALALLCLSLSGARAEAIVSARYAEPVTRYGHFALGRPHEYARLVAHTTAGRELAFELPEDEVFEDLAPRLVRRSAGAAPQLLAIVSQRQTGARLMLIGLSAQGLLMSAQSRPIHTRNRWLNPVGVADLDGDGLAEIAAVITPHIGGTLKVYRQDGAELREVAALYGFSNHVYGSPELALSAPLTRAGRTRLLVPGNSRQVLHAMVLEGGKLAELGRCALPEAASGALIIDAAGGVTIGLASGQRVAVVGECLR